MTFGYVRSFTYHYNHLFISESNGVFCTSDHGSSWYSINEGLWDVSRTGDITIMNDTLYLGTYDDGIWKRPINDIPLLVNDMKTKEGIKVYPNPSGGIFIIDGTVNQGKYRLIVTDPAGRCINEASNISLPYKLNISHLEDGIYFLSLDDELRHFNCELILNVK
jgi:hypothetical protein